ncbi:MAG: endolytic transglycosylase MltG [Acidobacteriota bacterium]|jgi:UPF0755 protein
MRRGMLWPMAILLASGVGLLGSLLVPYAAFPGREVTLEIQPGASAADVGQRLAELGVIRSPWVFRAWVRVSGTARRLQAGEYRFHRPASTLAVHRMLLAGQVVLHRVTVPEGLRIPEVVEVIAEAGFAEASSLQLAAADPRPIADLDPDAEDLEGYLFPDTYQFARGTSAGAIVASMVQRFRQELGPREIRQAARVGLTIREVVTLASLIEEETAVPEERPLVASVFHNRLDRGMLLQCDPTVIYGLRRDGLYRGRLTRAGLRHDSPYNTYLHPGLPPGPIASPGADSLRAALFPAETRLLYFVSRNDGTHQFSEDLDAHRRAVQRYQR